MPIYSQLKHPIDRIDALKQAAFQLVLHLYSQCHSTGKPLLVYYELSWNVYAPGSVWEGCACAAFASA